MCDDNLEGSAWNKIERHSHVGAGLEVLEWRVTCELLRECL